MQKHSPGVGVNAPMPNDITLVRVEIVIDGPLSSKTKPSLCLTMLSFDSRCHAWISKKASLTPKSIAMFEKNNHRFGINKYI